MPTFLMNKLSKCAIEVHIPGSCFAKKDTCNMSCSNKLLTKTCQSCNHTSNK